MPRVILLVCCLASSGLAFAASAQAQTSTDQATGMTADEEARMRFDLGRRYYDTGRFTDAAREFAEAHRLSGRTELLYNLFLAYRDAGDDVNAAETLRTYIGLLEPSEHRTQLEARLVVLDERIARARAGTTTDATTTDASTSTDATTTTTTDATTATTSAPAETPSGGGGGGMGLVPWIVIGAGGALLVGSLVTGLMALDARSTLDRMCPTADTCPAGFESTQSSGQALAITTDVLWVTGGLAAATGVVLAIIDATSSRSASQGASALCTDHGCTAVAWGRF